MGASLLTDHKSEIIAQAEAYLEKLRAATAAVHERLRAGILRARPQAHADEPMPEPSSFEAPRRESDDPIFATREFDLPPEVGGGLVDFDWKDSE